VIDTDELQVFESRDSIVKKLNLCLHSEHRHAVIITPSKNKQCLITRAKN